MIPVFKTTQQVKKGVREMNDRMNEFAKTQRNSSSPQTKSPDKSSKESSEDYIDFEEIK